MRKDVKLGFAIGGVLLSVLIVYVLVISGDEKRPDQVTLATSNDSAVKKTEEAKPPIVAATVPPASMPAETAKAPEPAPAVADAAPVPTPEVKPPASAPAVAAASGDNDRWAEGVLSTGKLPMMITTTPQPQPAAPIPPVPAEANRSTPGGGEAGTGASSNTSTMIATGGAASKPSSELTKPLTLASTSGTTGRTHVVQPNETFSSIAAAVYGNSAYFPHLIRANPTIDPRKLHQGMTINIPPVNDVRADSAQAGAAAARTTTIDPKTQYQVQAGDNLSKISIKLYGKPDRVNKLYDLNKAAIGADMAKVKPGMVLSLPEPPIKAN